MDTLFLLEWSASLLGGVYLWLVAKKNKWAFLYGGISSLLYMDVFYQSAVYAQSYLSFAYVILSIYAFWSWGKEGDIKIIKWSLYKHLLALLFIGLIGGIVLFFHEGKYASFSQKELFIVDLYIALFSLFATILGILKEKTNWIYWLFINFSCIILFIQQELYPTVILYTTYFFLGIYGFIQWNKTPMKQ